MSRIISIGKQDFVSLRKNHYFYIDKTEQLQRCCSKDKNIIVDVYRQNRYLNEQECFTENEHRRI